MFFNYIILFFMYKDLVLHVLEDFFFKLWEVDERIEVDWDEEYGCMTIEGVCLRNVVTFEKICENLKNFDKLRCWDGE